jgi:Uma2 family endonuclease
MSTVTTTHPTTTVPPPLEFSGPVALFPLLGELERLTDIPDRRVVFRGVDWSFYERVVDCIPEGSNIHVDYDGRDLEVMGNGPTHEDVKDSLSQLVKVIAEELSIPCKGFGETTWKRPEIPRALESDLCYYFQPDKLAAAARLRGSKEVSGYPNLDLAIEVDISRPEVDRAGIYAALGVVEIWRFDGEKLVIERLTTEGTYAAVDASGFLPIRAEEVRRWLVDEDRTDDSAWARRLRAEIRSRTAS